MRSTATGHKKGYALVDMRTKAQAGEARAALGSCIFFGRSLRVDWCRLGKLEEFQSCVLFVDKLPFGYIVRNNNQPSVFLASARQSHSDT